MLDVPIAVVLAAIFIMMMVSFLFIYRALAKILRMKYASRY